MTPEAPPYVPFYMTADGEIAAAFLFLSVAYWISSLDHFAHLQWPPHLDPRIPGAGMLLAIPLVCVVLDPWGTVTATGLFVAGIAVLSNLYALWLRLSGRPVPTYPAIPDSVSPWRRTAVRILRLLLRPVTVGWAVPHSPARRSSP